MAESPKLSDNVFLLHGSSEFSIPKIELSREGQEASVSVDLLPDSF